MEDADIEGNGSTAEHRGRALGLSVASQDVVDNPPGDRAAIHRLVDWVWLRFRRRTLYIHAVLGPGRLGSGDFQIVDRHIPGEMKALNANEGCSVTIGASTGAVIWH